MHDAPHPPPALPAWRRLPVGAELAPDGGTHFRVWAPARRRVEVVLEEPAGRVVALAPEAGGYHSALVEGVAAGARYRYRLDGEAGPFPDPASRFQPEGPHGPSEVVDPGAFRWTDAQWRGRLLEEAVLYEMHVGTFTPEGTWDAARRELPALAELGVTVLEVMPVAEFPGRFGWGYDGVDLFAPTRLYGAPDDFRRFVDAAHGLGLAVILDVVYNHLGPDGNYLTQFSPHYFSRRHTTEWGDALNFDDEHAAPVRELVVANAGYWVDEFHLDGLRLDATQSIFDDSPRHVLVDVAARVREAARGRATLLVNENEPQNADLVRPVERGGCGLDALWNDDWHHTAMVALTGRDEAYYVDYGGTPQELVSAAKHGFLYQGQWYGWQRKRRGSPALDLPPQRFVHFLENHDQVANSARGERCHRLASPGRLRALTALLLLGPQTPMLFQGQEFASSAPFLYFADHEPELAEKVRRGRAEFVAQFQTIALPEAQRLLDRPHDPRTFERCKLDRGERARNAGILALHRDLLRLRREDPCFSRPRHRGVDGAVLSDAAFVLRWLADDGADRLLVVNLGRTLHYDPSPEPLLAPPAGARWRLHFTTDDVRYGGLGTPPVDAADAPRSPPQKPDLEWPFENWRVPADCAVVLIPHPIDAT